MNNNPLVSVIIPCYNKSKYISDAIESVLNQTYSHIECIVIDDGSTDNSGEIVKKFEQSDNRVRYFYKENGGVSSTRNFGVLKARGEWIQFLDGDDWLSTDKIKRQLEYAGADLCKDDIVFHCDYSIVKQNDAGLAKTEEKFLFDRYNNEQLIKMIVGRKFGLETPTPIHVNNTLIRRNIFGKHLFDESVYYEDLIFFYDLLINNVHFIHTPIIGMYYRSNRDGISKVSDYNRIGYLQLLERVYNTNKDYLQYSSSIDVILEYFVRQNNAEMYDRALQLVRHSDVPVYSSTGKNIRKKILILDTLKSLKPFIKYRKKISIKYPVARIKFSIMKRIKSLLDRVICMIGVRIQNLEHRIATRTLPKFANNPRNLTIRLPRRIEGPQHMYLGDDIAIGPGSLLKTVAQYPSNSKVAEERGIPVQEFNPELIIGDRVTATGSLQVSTLNKIIIEDDVMFASNIFICDGLHGYENADIPYKYQPMYKIAPIIIGRGCWIGQNVVILPGVTIGEMSIIGANSVVTGSIPARCIAIGAPAKIIKMWDEHQHTWKSVEIDETN